MGEKSKISWTDATWNPWYGCHKKSPGCAYCYMFRWADRSGRDPEKVTRAKNPTFYAPMAWPPSVIFTCSLSDFFIKEADQWRADATRVMTQTPKHRYLILTKEIERAVELGYQPPSNAWMGITAENQRMLDKRAPLLFQIPASGYFLSLEPLLGPMDVYQWLSEKCATKHEHVPNFCGFKGIDLVIVGGESGGPESRALVSSYHSNHVWNRGQIKYQPKPGPVEWVRSLRDQCERAGAIFHFKQWGGGRPESGGNLVDGREWREMPKF